jgi:hypothetical protein
MPFYVPVGYPHMQPYFEFNLVNIFSGVAAFSAVGAAGYMYKKQ